MYGEENVNRQPNEGTNPRNIASPALARCNNISSVVDFLTEPENSSWLAADSTI
jgi:hypothetical protein